MENNLTNNEGSFKELLTSMMNRRWMKKMVYLYQA